MSVSIPDRSSSDLPTPPFVTVAGIPNFRDLGGYPVASSPNHSIRREIIYRCGEPSQVTEDGITTMNKLGITRIYDLRSLPEIERNKGRGRGGIVEWEGCERVFAPVFRYEDYSAEAIAVRFKDYADGGPEGFTRAYASILDHAPRSYKTILLHLANEPEKPLIIHCTAGKDRTGLICALVLSLCGVDDEVVAHEYSLTELGLTTEWKNDVINHLSHNSALAGNPQGARNLISAKSENMLATLKMIKERFGSAQGFIIQQCGLTKTDVENIRKNLIVEQPATHVNN